MNKEVQHNESKNRFEVKLEDGLFALAEYRRKDNKIYFTHTEVPDDYEGQGVGSALVEYALDYARREKLGVVPWCPFFKSYIERHEEYQDLVVAD